MGVARTLAAPPSKLVSGVQQANYVAAAQAPDAPIGLPKFGTPVIPPAAQEQEINLAGALAWAGLENPTIALAEEAVRASEALRMQARALLFPTLNAGTNVRIHQGTLQGANGIIHDDTIQSLYVGGGAGAVGAGTITIPGIQLVASLSDAYYAPQAAQQQVVGRQFDAAAIRHQTLLDVGTRYLALVAAQARRGSLYRSQDDLGEVARMTANFAKTGQGRASDAERARAGLLLLESQAERVQEEIAVAAADLARLLDLDPARQLRPADAAVPWIELVDPATPLAQLQQTALASHPELGARNADVAFAQIRVRQERLRPWLPVIAVGVSMGNFGGNGNESTQSSWTSATRLDVDVVAAWSLQNLGLGNRALQNRAQASAGEAEAERARSVNRIRDEVGESYVLVLARRRELEIAQRRIDSAGNAFTEDMRRAKNLEGRPIEVLRSLDLLIAARLDLIAAMAGYSDAQLRLFVAIGNSPAQR